MMQDLLPQLDLDYYRSALLLVARAEVKRLRQEPSTCVYSDDGAKSLGRPVWQMARPAPAL